MLLPPKSPFPSPPGSLNRHLQDPYHEGGKGVPRRFSPLSAAPDDRFPSFPSSQPVNRCVKFKKREFTEPREEPRGEDSSPPVAQHTDEGLWGLPIPNQWNASWAFPDPSISHKNEKRSHTKGLGNKEQQSKIPSTPWVFGSTTWVTKPCLLGLLSAYWFLDHLPATVSPKLPFQGSLGWLLSEDCCPNVSSFPNGL